MSRTSEVLREMLNTVLQLAKVLAACYAILGLLALGNAFDYGWTEITAASVLWLAAVVPTLWNIAAERVDERSGEAP